MDTILTHDQYRTEPLQRLLVAMYARTQRKAPPPLGDPAGEVQARIEQGRWIADCPSCPSAILASKAFPFLLCTDCGAPSWYRVVFPADAGVIEAALLRRPHVVNRNWLPTETIKDLERENAAHGVA